ncbi:EI24 domain-containing protein [Sphingomonas sp. BE138]|uniref:EI24 domain-containing protein n=1 Tax=Sphingomonas sp. BE138 TaxID=2817845 RepID=UPI00286B61D8|nr:EI24 domain-containing protein [Sphingomonas sp. BE138]
MVRAFLLSLQQLGDPPILRVLAMSLAITLAVFAALGALLWWGIDAALAGWAWHGALAGLAATVVTVLGAWLLFRAVAVLVVGLFADTIVAAVERRHYPAALTSARPVSVARGMRMGLASAGRFVAVNLLMTPVYIALLVTGVGTAAAFFVVNGWLLGRDLGEMVAARHLPAAAMRDWRAATAGQRFVLGLAATGLFVVPLLNILAPVIGAAMATHLFHGTGR